MYFFAHRPEIFLHLLKKIHGWRIVLVGNPVRNGSKKEAEMPMSNWTQLADEWLAKVNAARQLDVTVLPSINGIRDLPPTAETVIVDGFNTNQLPRVRKSS